MKPRTAEKNGTPIGGLISIGFIIFLFVYYIFQLIDKIKSQYLIYQGATQLFQRLEPITE